ncbi:hypothetical protein AB0M02_41070 [Actinoplanes sp. NPDC051861]|uniref:hypothetical protein n=1 Tax=Actinoplanes sp. NPDC051861 TaxID=3155170 RepID=UPI003428C8C3
MRPATHWRVLNYLYQHSLHTVRPYLTHVSKSQDVWYDHFVDLDNEGLIWAQIGDQDIDLHKVIKPGRGRTSPTVLKKIRIRLSAHGLATVLDSPLNQIRYTLGHYAAPIKLTKLFDGNNIAMDDVIKLQKLGHLKVTFTADPEEVTLVPGVYGVIFDAALTAKGREYLPR